MAPQQNIFSCCINIFFFLSTYNSDEQNFEVLLVKTIHTDIDEWLTCHAWSHENQNKCAYKKFYSQARLSWHTDKKFKPVVRELQLTCISQQVLHKSSTSVQLQDLLCTVDSFYGVLQSLQVNWDMFQGPMIPSHASFLLQKPAHKAARSTKQGDISNINTCHKHVLLKF